MYSSVRYTYRLKFEGISNEISAYLSNDELYLSHYEQQTGTSIQLYFQQMTAEKIAQRETAQKEALDLIKGDWSALSLVEYSNSSNGENTYHSATGQTIHVKEDGTFTAKLDREISGTWSFKEFYTYEDSNSKSYYYTLQPDGEDTALEASIYSGSASMSISLSSGEFYGYLRLYQLTDAELETVKQSAKEIIGTWTAESAEIYQNGAQEGTPVANYTGYTLTVLEDGTYTAQFSESFSGTWISDYSPYSKYSYTFARGNTSYSFTIDNDGKLSAWTFLNDGSHINIMMKKN